VNSRSTRLARRLAAVAGSVAFAFVIGACGNITVGGFQNVTVDVSGNAPETTQPITFTSPAALSVTEGPRPSDAPAEAGEEADGEEAEGEVEIDVRLALVTEAGNVEMLGRDDIRIKLDLQGSDEVEAIDELVPTARYTALRLTFTHIKVEVERGLVVNGEEIVGEIEVELDDPALVVTRAIDIQPVAGSRVDLLVDLNTPAWLAAVDPMTRTVDASAFAALVDLVVR
jgi:hypothetical protein